MEITIKHYDLTLSIERPDDSDAYEVLDVMVRAMVMMGYMPSSVDDCIVEMAEYVNEKRRTDDTRNDGL
jgi:hypothetical protein